MPEPRRLGTDAEDRAAAHLLNHGYTLLTRRYKAPHGEIDIIALDGDTLVFVEVKWRRSEKFDPAESVTERKIRRLSAAARHYLHEAGLGEREVRFDLIAIQGDVLNHHQNAFEPSSSSPQEPLDEPE